MVKHIYTSAKLRKVGLLCHVDISMDYQQSFRTWPDHQAHPAWLSVQKDAEGGREREGISEAAEEAYSPAEETVPQTLTSKHLPY